MLLHPAASRAGVACLEAFPKEAGIPEELRKEEEAHLEGA